MRRKSLILVIAVLALWAVGSQAAEGPFLADKHVAMGLNCGICHAEDPPKEKPQSTVCIGCHGDLKKMAERTAKLSPNPHEGEADCQACHHGHKASGKTAP